MSSFDVSRGISTSLLGSLSTQRLNENILREGLRLGLSREQVSAERFNYFTFRAITVELAQEEPLSLDASFEKYRGLDMTQIDGVLDLGLSREQVSAENFNCFTIRAITAELAKEYPLSLDAAFEKYRGLDMFKMEAMFKLGLSHEQFSAEIVNCSTFREIEAEPLSNIGVLLHDGSPQMPEECKSIGVCYEEDGGVFSY